MADVKTWPLWLRKLITDFIETGVVALLALSVALPSDRDSLVFFLGVLGAAIGGALLSAARRAIPSFILWVKDIFNVTSTT